MASQGREVSLGREYQWSLLCAVAATLGRGCRLQGMAVVSTRESRALVVPGVHRV